MSKQRKIGVIIDSLKLGVKPGIQKAKELGADGFQIWCTDGEMAPDNMTKADRQAFKKYVAGLGLEISALCGDLLKGFLNAQTNKEILPRYKQFIDLATDLGVRIVTSHIGQLPDDERHPSWAIGLEALSELGAYAVERGRVFGMETGPEEPIVLKRFLDKIGNKGVGVNYDPANLILYGPFDHIGGVTVLKDYIVHTHAKDGVRLMSRRSVTDPKQSKSLEVPLGDGSVAFKYYLKALDDIGYNGFLTIEREVGADPARDVAAAITFLRKIEVGSGKR